MLHAWLFYMDHEKNTSSSKYWSSSALLKNGWCRASAADTRFCGSNSMHKSRNSNARACSLSGVCISDLTHCTILRKDIGLSLRVGSVASKAQSDVNIYIIGLNILCNFAHIFIFALPKM